MPTDFLGAYGSNPPITKKHIEEDRAAKGRNKERNLAAAEDKRDRRRARNMRNALLSESGRVLGIRYGEVGFGHTYLTEGEPIVYVDGYPDAPT